MLALLMLIVLELLHPLFVWMKKDTECLRTAQLNGLLGTGNGSLHLSVIFSQA